ncbi:MAG: nucleoside-diphosphate sugar epimerase/dehydratase [Solirubrobacteraceae bacterium]|jgi:FlaA1/EpsC-like NDP-sugar epimerase
MGRRFRSATFRLHRYSLPQLVVDAGLVALAYYLGYLFRLDTFGGHYHQYGALFDRTLPWVVVGSALLLTLGGVYERRWRYTTQRDLESLLRLLVLDTILLVAGVAIFRPSGALNPPHGAVLLYFLLCVAFLAGVRLLARSLHDRRLRGFRSRRDARAVLIVGAGDGGRLVLRELLRNASLGLSPVGFIDDDPLKRRLRLDGVRVRGTTAELPRILDESEPDEVIIAIPSAPGELRMRVVTACRERGIPVRTLPTVFELLRGSIDLTRQVRSVQVEDVLGREPVLMELERVGAYLRGKVVLVTGAGGSIGSELCRQITRVGARRIVLVDHAEDNIFAIQRELLEDRHVHPDLLVPVLADVKEEERMREVFGEQRPQIVFHAAAYKHVGLLELNPVEAIHNNTIGTRVVAAVAGDLGAEAFVLISTDKAVVPATVMGASKALAECAVEIAQKRYPATRFMAVRFGNVLGSSGSVVPIFRRQIAAGGPVTVTDERMTRFFMTIPEAVQLVIRSGSLGAGGEVFVLDMGEPVSIMELARQMIQLSGLEPETDIAIDVIGARPGEKLHEELFNPFERQQLTPAEKIWIAQRDPLQSEHFEEVFDEVSLLVLEGDAAGLAAKVAQLTSMRAQPRTAEP